MRLAVCCITASLVLTMGSAKAEDEALRCPEKRRTISQLEAMGVSCEKARWVARRWEEKLEGSWPGDKSSVGRFTCRTRQTGYETYRIRCHRAPDEVVRFRWGV